MKGFSDPSAGLYTHATTAMGTVVTIRVIDRDADRARKEEIEARLGRALGWFREIEDRTTRFDAQSEMMQLTTRIGASVPVSPVLYEAVRFALAVAEGSGGAFDPTVGGRMEARGFNREYRSGQTIRTALESSAPATYRDVLLDPDRRAITLLRPLVLDLGAVAKGLAIDMAAKELRPFQDFAIDAGGDLYLAGMNPDGQPWSIGVRHPRDDRRLLDTLRVSNLAVCTSGDYARWKSRPDAGSHIVDPRAGDVADGVASVTVVARTAMAADALGTAAFVLGSIEGIRLLERQEVDGLIVTPTLERHATQGMWRHYDRVHASTATA